MYKITIKKPFLWFSRTSTKTNLNEDAACQLLSKHTGGEVKPADLHLFLYKTLIIGGTTVITLQKR